MPREPDRLRSVLRDRGDPEQPFWSCLATGQGVSDGPATFSLRSIAEDPKLRSVYFSFHYADVWKVNQIRNSGVVVRWRRGSGLRTRFWKRAGISGRTRKPARTPSPSGTRTERTSILQCIERSRGSGKTSWSTQVRSGANGTRRRSRSVSTSKSRSGARRVYSYSTAWRLASFGAQVVRAAKLLGF